MHFGARAATWLGLFWSVAVGWRVVIVFGMAMVMMVIAVAYGLVIIILPVILFMVVRDVGDVASQQARVEMTTATAMAAAAPVADGGG